ncbi:MAG TPA: hypothetical protein VK879_00445 [Candidatus Sulfomarinibacteraceae bacterium]|nr:hypothetical protein [Candidatus Sulfomarinibacteraceae bacterium]
MKRVLKLAGMLLILALVVGLVGASDAFAQETDPDATGAYNYGRGPFRGQGPGLQYRQVDPDVMHEAIAEALGVTVEEFETARAEGQTLYELAQELGIDMDTVWEAMRAVKAEAIEQALADGLITEAQAEWLLSRPGPGAGMGAGLGPCNGTGEPQGNAYRGSMRGTGQGLGQGAGQGFGFQR